MVFHLKIPAIVLLLQPSDFFIFTQFSSTFFRRVLSSWWPKIWQQSIWLVMCQLHSKLQWLSQNEGWWVGFPISSWSILSGQDYCLHPYIILPDCISIYCQLAHHQDYTDNFAVYCMWTGLHQLRRLSYILLSNVARVQSQRSTSWWIIVQKVGKQLVYKNSSTKNCTMKSTRGCHSISFKPY